MTKQDCQVEEMFIEMQKEERKKKSKKGLCNSTISPIYCLNPFISCTAAQKDITMYFRPFLQIFVAKNLAGACFMGY